MSRSVYCSCYLSVYVAELKPKFSFFNSIWKKNTCRAYSNEMKICIDRSVLIWNKEKLELKWWKLRANFFCYFYNNLNCSFAWIIWINYLRFGYFFMKSSIFSWNQAGNRYFNASLKQISVQNRLLFSLWILWWQTKRNRNSRFTALGPRSWLLLKHSVISRGLRVFVCGDW